MASFLRLLCVLFGVGYVVLGICLLIGWNLNPAPGVELFDLIFLSFIFCGVGIAGFRNWARIGITIVSIAFVAVLLIGQHMSLGESSLFFVMIVVPVLYLNTKKVRECFEDVKGRGVLQKTNWVMIVNISVLVVIGLAGLFLFGSYNPQNHFHQGDVFLKAGKSDQAIVEYNAVLKQEPKFYSVYSQRALAYINKGDYINAIADYTKQIDSFAVDSDDPYFNRQKADVVLNRAEVYFLKRDYEAAWDDVHRAESLGGKVRAEFVERLRVASDRDR